jgi:hypothetical protein
MTPKRLAANAANAKKCTGPRTERGKLFSSANGHKGGRPPQPGSASFRRRAGEAARAEGRDWGPSDPEFMRLVLEQMRKEHPKTFATMMRFRPDYRELMGLD